MPRFKFTLAKCPLEGGHTSSDWWEVISRHAEHDSAEDALAKIAFKELDQYRYIIFNLCGYAPGQRFNIRVIHALRIKANYVSNKTL